MPRTDLFSFKISKKLELYFVLSCLFIFIFLWDLEAGPDFRLFIIFPAILIIYKIFKNKLNIKILYFPLFIVSACLLHLLISYVNLSQGLINQYSLTSNVKPILSIFLISLIVTQYYSLLVNSLSKIINIFVIIFTIEIFLSTLANIENINNDQNLRFSNLFYNCNNGLVSYVGVIFGENSHLAMISVPIILSGIINKNLFRKNFVFYIFIIFNYITYSTTFHVGIILSSFFVLIFLIFKKEHKKFFLIFLIMAISILFLFYDKTCNLKFTDTVKVWYMTVLGLEKNKINLAQEDSEKKNKINLTSDVHHNGFLVAKYSLINSNYVGLGLDNYKVGHKYFQNKFAKALSSPTAAILNEKDASSNLIKIFAEFGIFVIFPTILFLYFVIRSKENLDISIFLISIILTQLIRGAGYFNGGFALFSLMICYSVFASKKPKND